MKTRILTAILSFVLIFGGTLKADEGMWLPFLIGQKKYAEMQKLGLKLTQKQLYDINNASLKDAIVRLDGGNCTGEMISSEGLLLTNHHCGYGDIQAHSTVDHDYLTDGFWAMSRDEELVNESKTASFLIRIEDVTEKVLANVTDTMSEADRNNAINEAADKVEKEAIGDTHFEASVRSMFAGNEYYLFVYETFLDVRLVGAPPSSIGKYGGDTDNWIWPRHTGDFSMFRVYMAPDGTPAKYSKDNIPYKPKHSLPISLKGVQENDYAMIFGYPGSTDRYLTSYGIDLKVDQLNPATVKLRDIKMKIMKEEMDKSDKVRIQYAENYAYLGNFWKKDAEETKALKRLKVADQKREVEKQFAQWANATPERKEKYGNVISDFENYYKTKTESQSQKAFWYLIESAFNQGADIISFSRQGRGLMGMLKQDKDPAPVVEKLRVAAAEHFKEYNEKIDKGILAAMFKAYSEDVPEDLQPSIFKEVHKKFKGDFYKYADYVFNKSVFSSEEKLNKFLDKPKLKTLEKDPAILAFNSLYGVFMDMNMKEAASNTKFDTAKRLFIAGLREMNPNKDYYPDANSTMRVTYGSVKDYVPRDAVEYDFITYLDGVMEKEDPTNEEFIVAPKLKELYKAKDYGQYGMGDKMPVCFIANLDITGGNSGSPVINGNGELIGTAFDGNSEAMSSDIQFDKKLQRTIVCDIRYVLFVVDKYAGATNLIKEMKIVKD
ncbi:MAG: S46 family peptidase [Bacteroidales bacterium]|nr:S46 family peptidase [Bacteroidales bacterium]MCF8454846.1 S46 family peptidase [Bacteroidales bacterium]